MRRLKHGLFCVTVWLGTLACAELGLRLMWERPPKRIGTNLVAAQMFVPDDRLGWLMAPNRTVRHGLYGGHQAMVHTNSLGFRDDEHDVQRSDDAFRIVVLGDSFVWGFGVDNQDIFTVHLRNALSHVEVINLGVTGYNLSQTHQLLRQTGLAYEPDLVVVVVCQNDITTSRIPSPPEPSDERAEEATGGRWLKQQLTQQLLLYDLVRETVGRNKKLARFMVDVGLKEGLGGYDQLDVNVRPALLTYPEPLKKEWNSATAELRSIHETCRAHGIPVLVAAIPARQAIEEDAMLATLSYVDYEPEDFAWDKPYRNLGEYCDAMGVSYVNGYPTFRQSEPPLYLRHDMHFNPAGHQLFAELLAPEIDRLLTSGQVAAP